MHIRTAWVVTPNDTFELVAAADEDNYDPSYFEMRLDDVAVDYGTEVRVLEIAVANELLHTLFADVVGSG